jgi:5-hydroxyisourate hydrolase
MTKLTTHVLDIYSGRPGKGIKVDLYYYNNDKKTKISSIILNNDGRPDQALIEGTNFKEGKYELVFFVGDYFKKITDIPKVPFLDDVIIKFGISNVEEHYHVPLLVSPWSYSTYRGS